jgi:hypothetical protein
MKSHPTVQPGAGNGGDEKLRSIGVWSGISHREKTAFGVLQFEVFIFKSITVNGLSSSSIVSSKISSLAHKLGYDSMELAGLEGQGGSLLSSAQGSKIFSSFWDYCKYKNRIYRHPFSIRKQFGQF